MKQKLTELKGEIENSTTIIGDFSTFFFFNFLAPQQEKPPQ